MKGANHNDGVVDVCVYCRECFSDREEQVAVSHLSIIRVPNDSRCNFRHCSEHPVDGFMADQVCRGPGRNNLCVTGYHAQVQPH